MRVFFYDKQIFIISFYINLIYLIWFKFDSFFINLIVYKIYFSIEFVIHLNHCIKLHNILRLILCISLITLHFRGQFKCLMLFYMLVLLFALLKALLKACWHQWQLNSVTKPILVIHDNNNVIFLVTKAFNLFYHISPKHIIVLIYLLEFTWINVYQFNQFNIIFALDFPSI